MKNVYNDLNRLLMHIYVYTPDIYVVLFYDEIHEYAKIMPRNNMLFIIIL